MFLSILFASCALLIKCTNAKAESLDKGNENRKTYQSWKRFEGLPNLMPITKQRHKAIEYPAYILIASKYFESLLKKNNINNERSAISNNYLANKIPLSSTMTNSNLGQFNYLSRKDLIDKLQAHNKVENFVQTKRAQNYNNLPIFDVNSSEKPLNPISSLILYKMETRDKTIPKYSRLNIISRNSVLNNPNEFKNFKNFKMLLKSSQDLNNNVFLNGNNKISGFYRPDLKNAMMVDRGEYRRQKANREESASVRTILENEKVLELKSKQEELEEQQLVEELQLREVRKKILEKKLQKLKLEQQEINNKLQAQKQELLLQSIKEKLLKKKKDMEELSEKEIKLNESLKKLRENKKKPLYVEQNSSLFLNPNKSFTPNEYGKNMLSIAGDEKADKEDYNSEFKLSDSEPHNPNKINEPNSCSDGSNEYCHFDHEEQEELPTNLGNSTYHYVNSSLDATHNDLKSQNERFDSVNTYPVAKILESQSYPVTKDELNPLDAFLENRNPIDDKSHNLNTQAENIMSHSSKSNNLDNFNSNFQMSIRNKNPNDKQNLELKNIKVAEISKQAEPFETLDLNSTASKDGLLDQTEATSETNNQPEETTKAHETNIEGIVLKNGFKNSNKKEQEKLFEARLDEGTKLDEGTEYIKGSSTHSKDKNDQSNLKEGKDSGKELNEKFGKYYGEYPNEVPKKHGTAKNIDVHPIIYRDPIPGSNRGKNATEANKINTSKIAKLNETVKANKTSLLDKGNFKSQSKEKSESLPKSGKLKQTQNQAKLENKIAIKADELNSSKETKSKPDTDELKPNVKKENYKAMNPSAKLPAKLKADSQILTKVNFNLDKLKDLSKTDKHGNDNAKTNEPILEKTKLKKLASATEKPILNETDDKLYNQTFNNDKVNTSAEDKSDNIKFSAQVDRASSNQNSKGIAKINKTSAESIKHKNSNDSMIKNSKNIPKISSAKFTSNLNKVLTKNQTNPDKITIQVKQSTEGFAPHPIKANLESFYSYSSVTTTKQPNTLAQINQAAEKKPVTNPSPTNPPTKLPPTTTIKKTSLKPASQANENSSYNDFCKTRNTGTYPNEQDCTKYWICVNGVTYPAQCGKGLFYNVSTNQCTPFPAMDVTSIFWTTCDKKRNSVVE